MTSPRIDPRISWGNIASLVATVLTAIAMLAALLMWGARQDQRMLQSEHRIEQNTRAIAASEVRIRSLEQISGRQDEKLGLILEDLREVKRMLQGR